MIFPDPALGLLGRRKFVGLLRKQGRRFKTPAGAIFTLLGLLMVVVWLASLLFPTLMRPVSGEQSPPTREATQLAVAMLVLLTCSGAFQFRGLFLPKEEIEWLLAAPVSRADIVRYRLLMGLVPTALGAVFVGLLAVSRGAHPVYGALGTVIGMMTLPILNQCLALLSGELETRAGTKLPRAPLRIIGILGGIAFGLFVAFSFIGTGSRRGGLSKAIERAIGIGSFDELAKIPWIAAITAPLRPWAELVTTRDIGSFAFWGAICIAIGVALFEITARLPIDFRELTLETSADIARRLNRMRRGGGAASASVSAKAAGWRVPWLFGRGPIGAIAWRKSASILRRARTFLTVTLLIALVAGGVVGWLESTRTGEAIPPFVVPSLIAGLGTLYLCLGLRFDFREDLDQMVLVKSWPLGSARIFLGTLLPEVALVAALLTVALLSRAALLRDLGYDSLVVALAAPPFVLAWLSLDNVVFLLLPVRFTPGQDGALQNAGRGVVMGLLRMGLLFGLAITLAIPAGGAFALHKLADLDARVATALAVSVGYFVLVLDNALLIYVGGRMLQRFDVARDRG